MNNQNYEDIAIWAQSSYQGDAAFMVNAPYLGGGSIASSFWEGLRAHFISQPFIRAIQGNIAELRDEICVSIISQNEGTKLYKKYAEKFLTDMFKAHKNGKQPFGDNYQAITRWVKDHYKEEPG